MTYRAFYYCSFAHFWRGVGVGAQVNHIMEQSHWIYNLICFKLYCQDKWWTVWEVLESSLSLIVCFCSGLLSAHILSLSQGLSTVHQEGRSWWDYERPATRARQAIRESRRRKRGCERFVDRSAMTWGIGFHLCTGQGGLPVSASLFLVIIPCFSPW